MKKLTQLLLFFAAFTFAAFVNATEPPEWDYLHDPGNWHFLAGAGQVQHDLSRPYADANSDLKHFTFSVGAAYQTDSLTWIISYDDLGKLSSGDSTTVPKTEGCSHYCGKKTRQCTQSVKYGYTEDVSGLRLAIATPGDGLYGEMGLFLYKADTRSTALYEDGTAVDAKGGRDLRTGWEVAGGYTFANDLSVQARYYSLGGVEGIPVMSDSAWTLTLAKMF